MNVITTLQCCKSGRVTTETKLEQGNLQCMATSSGIVYRSVLRMESPREYKVKGKGKGLDTCYSAAYMSQTRDQQRFTISEVTADWHKPVVPQRIM